MEIGSLRFPDELYYDEHHQWARANGGLVTTGITDYAQSVAGDIVYVDLPRPGVTAHRGEAIGSLESGKWVGRLYAPVGGTVVAVNGVLAHAPRTLNSDPYGEGWIVRIAASDPAELALLMRGDALRDFIRGELERDGLADAPQGAGDGEP